MTKPTAALFVAAPDFPARVSVQLPRDFRDAITRTASALGLTMADYIRISLAERLLEDGEEIAPVLIRSRDSLDGLFRKRGT